MLLITGSMSGTETITHVLGKRHWNSTRMNGSERDWALPDRPSMSAYLSDCLKGIATRIVAWRKELHLRLVVPPPQERSCRDCNTTTEPLAFRCKTQVRAITTSAGFRQNKNPGSSFQVLARKENATG